MIIASACLCGVDCKYNAGNNLNEDVYKLFKEGKVVLVCPEQMGGLKTPRVPAEIVGGDGLDVLEGRAKVLTKEGEDVTKEFIKGAEETLKLANALIPEKIILKAKSPSCGCGNIYDGTFSSKLINGNGVAAELLIKNKFSVITEEEMS